MAKRTKKEPPKKPFRVSVDYTIRQDVIVEATDEEDARLHVFEVLQCAGDAEIVDWEVRHVREEKED